jgi:hypothetical protein
MTRMTRLVGRHSRHRDDKRLKPPSFCVICVIFVIK